MIAVVGGIFYFNGGLNALLNPSTVRAFGDLLVDFHVLPVGAPIFQVNNMKPGDSDSKPVDVLNNGSIPYQIAVKGVRTGGTGSNPVLDTGLKITIKQGTTKKYEKTLGDFFTESGQPNGILLDIVNPSQDLPYNFQVDFPSTSGNGYQGKSVIFDLTFGTVIGKSVVINEVYYQVDSKHGLESPKERNDKTKAGINNEWLELYNPTDHDINLKNWTLTDSSGLVSKINANKIIKSESFIVVSKDASTWKYWNIHPKSDKIELGNQLGNGLDNNGDKIILKDSSGTEIDRMSWGADTSGFTPAAANPRVAIGSSTERKAPGMDTDAASDWMQRDIPTLGK